jgi:hypothetical protein
LDVRATHLQNSAQNWISGFLLRLAARIFGEQIAFTEFGRAPASYLFCPLELKKSLFSNSLCIAK